MTETAVRERPILMHGHSVRGILYGQKRQTRRVAKRTAAGHLKEPGGHRRWHPGDPEAVLACPSGQPGDRLWVREAWRCAGVHESDGYPVYYRADAVGSDVAIHRWRPSIHMPRWASRLTLEVTGVRVERVQEISESDAMAEGCGNKTPCWQHAHDADDGCRDARDEFQERWDTLNATRGYGWKSNCWVWVVEFRPTGGDRA